MKTPRRKRTGYQLQSFPKPAPDSDRGSVDRKSSRLLNVLVPRRSLSRTAIRGGDDVWIPAGVYPVPRYGAGMTNVASHGVMIPKIKVN